MNAPSSWAKNPAFYCSAQHETRQNAQKRAELDKQLQEFLSSSNQVAGMQKKLYIWELA